MDSLVDTLNVGTKNIVDVPGCEAQENIDDHGEEGIADNDIDFEVQVFGPDDDADAELHDYEPSDLDDLVWDDDDRFVDYDNPDLDELDWGDERQADYDHPDLDALDWWLDAVTIVATRVDAYLDEILDFVSLEICCKLDETVCEAVINTGSCEDLATSSIVCIAAHNVLLALQAEIVDDCLIEFFDFISLEIWFCLPLL